MKTTYVNIGSKLEFRKFILYCAPLGWKRIDLLKNQLSNDKEFRSKFTEEEYNMIMTYKEMKE